MANARNIAEKFVADKVDLIAACTTPNAQAAIRLTKGTNMPVAFGCVTNPVESGVLTRIDQPTGTNVTGIYGIPPVAKMWDLLMELHPKAKMVGTIYNPAESNSLALNEANKAEAKRRGVAWAEIQISSSAEILAAARALAERADCLLMPQDNTVASAFDAIVVAARDNKLPLFSYDTSAVERGALAATPRTSARPGSTGPTKSPSPSCSGKTPAPSPRLPTRPSTCC